MFVDEKTAFESQFFSIPPQYKVCHQTNFVLPSPPCYLLLPSFPVPSHPTS